MSNIVVLSGSVRKGGNTELLVQAFVDGAKKNNSVEVISVADYKVNPCIGFVDDIIEHCKLAYKTANEQREYFKGPLGNDVFQCSPMPWVTFTHISHTNSGKKDNARSK